MFKIFILLFSFFYLVAPSYGNDSFGRNCFLSNFQTSVEHKIGPLGLFKNLLIINKNKCTLEIENRKFLVFKKLWSIDICRGPVHIKSGAYGLDVLKRLGKCTSNDLEDNEFCKELNEMQTIIQDDGLIFAPGSKEDIKSDHGKFYCTFKIVNQYLDEGKIFFENDEVDIPLNNQPVNNSKEILNDNQNQNQNLLEKTALPESDLKF